MTDLIDDGGVASPMRAQIGDSVRARLDRNPMVSRIDTPALEIYGRRDFLDSGECAGLRALIDADAQPSTLFSGSANADYRTSHSCNLSPWDRLVRGVSDRICALTGLPAENGETLQGRRYTPGQEYK
ncbi:MAG TPA: 2OG-Fe(II) oxygenase, partial [Sphingobium sp.]